VNHEHQSSVGEPLALRLDAGLGAGSEARSYVHVHAPQPDDFGIRRTHCQTCERRTYMLWRHTPWYGCDETCLRCGEEWQDGERSERPFAPRWRERRKARARQLFRCLKAGRTPTIEPAMQARIDAMASKMRAPNVGANRAAEGGPVERPVRALVPKREG